MKNININNIKYYCFTYNRQNTSKKSLEPIGLDTEAYTTGECFMIATSEGDVFRPEDFPACLFSRTYRGKHFVCYNLKYDSGAMLQGLPIENLEQLRSKDKTVYDGFTYSAIGYKSLTIRRGKNSVHFWDMLNFYQMRLEAAATLYLDSHKLDETVSMYTKSYVLENWVQISRYCVQDADLVRRLAEVIIKRFESYGVYPKKLYSVAYISYQYFRTHTPYVTVKKYWEKHKDLLQYALYAYAGGKFEVTQKGPGYYYEYDIVSAYPAEIRNLVDISWARVVKSSKYRRESVYGFLHVAVDIPFDLHTSTICKRHGVNVYAVGQYETYCTKQEYEYLTASGADVSIIEGYWIHVDNKQYPYRKEIDRLTELKHQFKKDGKELDYHTVKILMNSLYGKFVQLIKTGEGWKASSCWNPIYAAVITANCRIKVSNWQTIYNTITAVHTDSVISTAPLPFGKTGGIGELIYETEGEGVVLGAGIYEIGEKIKFRGYHGSLLLTELIRASNTKLQLTYEHAYTWREVAFRGWDSSKINLFEELPKVININFDQKRLWIDDWKNWREVLNRTVESYPLIYSKALF
ncbi:hypothetical protein ES708_15463 [subsurface metagenome]